MSTLAGKKSSEIQPNRVLSLLESSYDPVIISDDHGRIRYINSPAADLFGYSSGELLGSSVDTIVREQTDQDAGEQIETLYEKSRANVEAHGTSRSGRSFPVTVNSEHLTLNGEKLICLFVNRVTGETRNESMSDAIRRMLKVIPCPGFIVNPDGRIRGLNMRSEDLLGVSHRESEGMDFSDYFIEQDQMKLLLKQAFHDGSVTRQPVTLRNGRGGVLFNATSYRANQNEERLALVTLDIVISEQQEQEMIKRLGRELELHHAELESFYYSVSHNLRAPLRGINGFVALFKNRYLDQVDEEGRRLLERVTQNVDKMENQINDLLFLFRSGTKSLHFTMINMNELVNSVLSELEVQEKAEVSVGDLGKAIGDVASIKQVVTNLVSNAIKYSEQERNPRIEIGSIAHEKERHYYVKDNGAGFDMEYSNKLFGVFQRLHDPIKYEGAGIGLALVKQIISRHGGRVWAKGKEDKGATFYFSLKSD